MEISDRTFLVAGGASGLGAATATALLERGAHVVVADRAGEAPAGAVFVPTDVTDDAQVRAAVEAATRQPSPFCGVVNCAGVGTAEKVLGRESAPDATTFGQVIAVNLTGTFTVLRHAAQALRDVEPGAGGERGVIVNTASAAAFDGQIGQAAYAASKGGVVAMTLPIARELARYGIRVVAIAPGLFHTPMLDGLPQEARDALGAQVPFPSRLGDPAEFAALACHVVSNQMINAEVIRLDGALRMAAR